MSNATRSMQHDRLPMQHPEHIVFGARLHTRAATDAASEIDVRVLQARTIGAACARLAPFIQHKRHARAFELALPRHAQDQGERQRHEYEHDPGHERVLASNRCAEWGKSGECPYECQMGSKWNVLEDPSLLRGLAPRARPNIRQVRDRAPRAGRPIRCRRCCRLRVSMAGPVACAQPSQRSHTLATLPSVPSASTSASDTRTLA